MANNISKQSNRTDIATFPTCSCCGSLKVPVFHDAEIWCQIDSQSPFLVPKGQGAQCLRFLDFVGEKKVLGEHLNLALGNCLQVSRLLNTLKNTYQIPIKHEDIPKKTKAGSYRVHWLDKSVNLWEQADG